MAKARAEIALTELKELTEDISSMLYEDQLNMLIKKFDETEDSSSLIPEVERAVQIGVSIQEFMKAELGESQAQLSQFKREGRGVRKSIDTDRIPSDQSKSSELSLTVQNPSDQVTGDEVEMWSIVSDGSVAHEHDLKCQEEENPSLHSNASCNCLYIIQEAQSGENNDSLGFEMNQSSGNVPTDSESSNTKNTDISEKCTDLCHSQSDRSRSDSSFSVKSLNVMNPSSESILSGSRSFESLDDLDEMSETVFEEPMQSEAENQIDL